MLKKHLLALVALSSVSFLPMAQAADEVVDDRFYVAPFGTYLRAGGDRNSNDGFGGGMGFGKMLDEHFNVELKGFYQFAGGENGNGGADLSGGLAEVQYYIMRDKFSPYTVLGLGGMNTSVNGDAGAGFIGEAGAGLTYEVSDNFLIRSDVRYRYNQNFNSSSLLQSGTNEYHDMVVNVGFVIPLGPKPQPVVAEAPAPAPTPVAVPDCSTMDDDHDGVNNCDDLCPTTLPGAAVSIRGCWIVDVKFDNDKAVIKPEYFGNLDNAAKLIKEHPELKIEIQGHTSKTGGFKHNMNLSHRRADAVKKYLVDGEHLPNLTTEGYGWTRPIDTNDTEQGRANNRRVQLEVEGQPQQPLNPQQDPLLNPQQ
ncbi:MAG: OmpA family protein [Methylococcaceae bacterium]|nr:OmpA family protein [Methylococcaceae bacterium]